MRNEERVSRLTGFIALATFTLIVAVLYIAKTIMVPIALAALLAFLLSPLVDRLKRWGLNRSFAVSIVATAAFASIGLLFWVMAEQVVNLGQELPSFEQNVSAKLNRLKMPHPPPALSGAIEMADRLQKELADANPVPAPGIGGGTRSPPAPVAVQLAAPHRTPLEIATNLGEMVAGPLSMAFIVVIFVIAILLQGDDLRGRFVTAFSAGKPAVITSAIEDASDRVSRYLVMQLVVNAAYGLFISLGLTLIGIPHAPLWGLLATLLRFIPYLGPWMAAALPLVLSVAIDPGWSKLGYTALLYAGAEIVTSNLIEVLLYGASTGVSGLALMFAAVFWTWLWGIPGLFLSTPLTVCLLVLGESIPGFKFLSVLLSNSALGARSTGPKHAHPHPQPPKHDAPAGGR